MPAYEVTLHGSGLVLEFAEPNSTVKVGFYTTRWVRARDPNSAEAVARQQVLQELGDRSKGPPQGSVMIEVEEITRISWLVALMHRKPGGFTYYPEDAASQKSLFPDAD